MKTKRKPGRPRIRKPKPKRPVGRPEGTKNPTPDSPRYNIPVHRLDAVDRLMLTIVAAKPAISTTQLSKDMGMSFRLIKKRRDRAIFQTSLFDVQKDALECVKDMQKEAAHRLKELISSDDEKIALGAIQTVLRPILPKTSIVKNENTMDITIRSMNEDQLKKFITEGLDGLNLDNAIDTPSKPIAEIPAETQDNDGD